MRKLDELKKALSESDIDDKLIQNQINKVIQSLVLVDNPLRNNLPRKPGSGQGAFINQMSALPTAQTVNDTTDFTESEPTYDTRLEFPFKIVGTKCKITTKAQLVGRSYTDIKTQVVNSALDSIKNKEEDLIINGDASTEATEFSGLKKLIPSGQIVDESGTDLTLAMMDEAIDLCFGIPDICIMSKKARRRLIGLMQAQQQWVNVVEVNGGFKLLSYNGIPVYVSENIANNEGGGGDSRVYFLNTNKVWIETLRELELVNLATTSSQYDQFDVRMMEVLVLANQKYCSEVLANLP